MARHLAYVKGGATIHSTCTALQTDIESCQEPLTIRYLQPEHYTTVVACHRPHTIPLVLDSVPSSSSRTPVIVRRFTMSEVFNMDYLFLGIQDRLELYVQVSRMGCKPESDRISQKGKKKSLSWADAFWELSWQMMRIFRALFVGRAVSMDWGSEGSLRPSKLSRACSKSDLFLLLHSQPPSKLRFSAAPRER